MPETMTAAKAMSQIDLREYAPSGPHALSRERDTLRRALHSLTVEAAMARKDEYLLTPGSTVGAVEVGDLSVLIRPKGIRQLLSFACYAIGRVRFQETDFRFPEDGAARCVGPRASVPREARSRGAFHCTEEEALQTVRGRIRFDDQVRRRFGIPLPVEVRYDEFTDASSPTSL